MNIKKLLPLIGIIILVFILVFFVDFNQIFTIFSKINPLYTFICFFALVPLILLANVEWQILLRKQKIHVSFWYSIKNFFIGYFYGFITPGALGAYTKSLYLQEESKAPLPKCVSNIIIFNTIDYLALLLLGAIGAIYLSRDFPYLFYPIIVVIIFVLALFLFFFKTERSKILFRKIIQSRVFATLQDRLEESIDSFYEDLPRFRDVILPFAISFFGWVIKYVELFFIAILFDFTVPFWYFIMIMAVGDVIASLPISIYGIGTREASLLPLFSMFAVTNDQIISLSLFWFVIIWLTPSIIGAFVTIRETKKISTFKLDKQTVERFEKYMKKHPELYEQLAVVVKKNISRKKKDPYIVDLGIGPGLLSLELLKKFPDSKIIGVDPSDEMLKRANKNIKSKKFETRLGGIEKIPVTNNLSDIVVSRFSLTYWDTPRVNFAEINRILKPKGKVVMEFLNRDFPRWRLFFIKIRMYLKSAGFDTIKYHIDAYNTAYSLNSVKTLFKDSGFKILNIEGDKKDWKFVIVAQKK
jgi:uncharacterized protein (TIRG00374 family)